MKLAKKFRPPVEPRSFGSGLIVGCFLVSMTYVVISRNETGNCLPSSPLFPSSSSDAASTKESTVGNHRKMQVVSGRDNSTQRSEASEFHDGSASPASTSDFSDRKKISVSDDKSDDDPAERSIPMCDRSSYRVDICDLSGDIRITGKNLSSVMVVADSPVAGSRGANDSWQMKPYPRKYDFSAMAKVKPLNLKTLHIAGGAEAPQCSVKHSVPGILFSTGGHCGNCFHDFADVLVPLFETAAPFGGRIQFVIAGYQGWWMHKYRPYLDRLSSYDVIDFDADERVHCFEHLIVGLRAGRDLIIDAAASPGAPTIADFVNLTRAAYSLDRERAWPAAAAAGAKPRLLFIARGGTRRFVNLEDLVAAAEEVGYEAVASEPDFFDVARFGGVVNSCDVMVGVHGAGLTNMLFLPAGGVMIQVVPLGKLDWIASNFYAEPAMARGLKYLQYGIRKEESTLSDQYPPDHAVFRDPESIHKEGWFKLLDVYLRQQDVRLDVDRFKRTLEGALRLLRGNERLQKIDDSLQGD